MVPVSLAELNRIAVARAGSLSRPTSRGTAWRGFGFGLPSRRLRASNSLASVRRWRARDARARACGRSRARIELPSSRIRLLRATGGGLPLPRSSGFAAVLRAVSSFRPQSATASAIAMALIAPMP